MQLSKLSLVTLFLASFSAAISLEDAIAARDIVVVKAASGEAQKRNLEVRSKKVKGTGGGDDDDDDDDDDNNTDGSAASSVHINLSLMISGASAVAVAAMML